MTSPAEIANDMAAHAAYWAGRDVVLNRLCDDAAWVIRAFGDKAKVDGRTYGGLHRRLLSRARRQTDRSVQGYPDFDRARLCLECLRAEAVPT